MFPLFNFNKHSKGVRRRDREKCFNVSSNSLEILLVHHHQEGFVSITAGVFKSKKNTFQLKGIEGNNEIDRNGWNWKNNFRS